MAWTNPPTWVTDQVVTATDLNTYLTDDLIYLFQGRPGSHVKRDNNANYTTTSTSFVNVDGTNLTVTLNSLKSGKALVYFTGVVTAGAVVSPYIAFDFTVDGTRYGGNEGIAVETIDSYAYQRVVTFIAVVTGLSSGNHTFTLQWKTIDGSTAALCAGNGGTSSPGGIADDYFPLFGAVEIG